MVNFTEICCTLSETLWEYRSSNSKGQVRLSALKAGDVLHMMAVNADKEIVEHYIVRNPAAGFEDFVSNNLGGIKPEMMTMGASFFLAPKAFSTAGMPEIGKMNSFVNIDSDLVLCSDIEDGFHAAQPFYNHVSSIAKKYDNYTGFWYTGNSVMVAFFQHGKCMLLNQFPSSNEVEAMYFVLAPSVNAGLNVGQVRFEVLCDVEFQKPLADAISRFIPDLSLMQVELPYETDQYPVFLAQSFLIYSYLTCGLPVAN